IHEAIRLQEQAHGLYVSIGDPFRAVLGEQGLGIIYLALGETERAQQYTLRGFERARRYGVRYNLGWLHWNSGVIALAQGDCSSRATGLWRRFLYSLPGRRIPAPGRAGAGSRVYKTHTHIARLYVLW